jgi:hypothetical protein
MRVEEHRLPVAEIWHTRNSKSPRALEDRPHAPHHERVGDLMQRVIEADRP